ncbi:uncharacterized protein PADG_05598 [Paracoccidioides brasiliensis Pb18]|uniref:Uncharacterized protein n=1 Tax=Paracoccidioides brasiliensis (strain Pb18) TaxID=502780 RepID=C1GEB2_PARBD|nr:uncharacterized protein PADG_05598 [Paracoccidioides brasiliensis Pb18]EEH49519.2 hypothetical protein PADG_05598 [Paracoccidioides brasiliensis Pb18]
MILEHVNRAPSNLALDNGSGMNRFNDSDGSWCSFLVTLADVPMYQNSLDRWLPWRFANNPGTPCLMPPASGLHTPLMPITVSGAADAACQSRRRSSLPGTTLTESYLPGIPLPCVKGDRNRPSAMAALQTDE